MTEFLQQSFQGMIDFWHVCYLGFMRVVEVAMHSTKALVRFFDRATEVITLITEYLTFIPNYMTTIIAVLVCLSIIYLLVGR